MHMKGTLLGKFALQELTHSGRSSPSLVYKAPGIEASRIQEIRKYSKFGKAEKRQ